MFSGKISAISEKLQHLIR